jgi:hypothetical protein
MSNVTLKLAGLSKRERLALVEKRFNGMASKVYAGDLSRKEENIHHLLYNLIAYYQNLLSYEEQLAYTWGC